MPAGAQCCASLTTYGEGVYCEVGTSCTVQGGYVVCANESGDIFSADSSAADVATSTTDYYESSTTDTSDEPTSTDGGGGSSSGSSKSKSIPKKKSKAWIAGAVIGPLIGIAIVAAVTFFLAMLKKKKAAKANAGAGAGAAYTPTTGTDQQGGGAPGGQMNQTPQMNPPMNQTSNPQMAAAPMAQNADSKTPAYTQQYEAQTPMASPPPQWTPASPAPNNISPLPVHAQPMYAQQTTPSPQPFTNELHAQSLSPAVSPMNSGNGAYGQPGYPQQPMHQPQPMYGNTTGFPTAQGGQTGRDGAQELRG
jgi:hypothetical protein